MVYKVNCWHFPLIYFSPTPQINWCLWPRLAPSCLPLDFNEQRFIPSGFNQRLTVQQINQNDHLFICYAANTHSFARTVFRIDVKGSY